MIYKDCQLVNTNYLPTSCTICKKQHCFMQKMNISNVAPWQAEETENRRRQCEARQVLAWPLAMRRKYLALVEQKRGAVALNDLQREIIAQWKQGKGA